MKRVTTTAWLVATMFATMIVGGCGKQAGEGGAPASGSGSASSAPTPAPAPTPAARAKAAVDTMASVVTAFTTAAGTDRCGAADRIHAAVIANADKIAQVKAAFADRAVLTEVGKIAKDDPLHSAMEAWGKTLIDGDCKVTEDRDTVMAMLKAGNEAGPAPAAPAAPTPPAPSPSPGGRGGIPECEQLRVLAQRVDGCAALPANAKQTLLEMAKNNLDATDRPMPDNYKDYARSKCAGTADTLTQYLGRYGCK
jgi:hypothetical protein